MKAGPHTVTASASSRTSAVADTTRLQPFLRSSADTFDWTGRPHIADARRSPGRSTRPGPATRRAAGGSSCASPTDAAAEARVRQADHLDAGAPRLPPAGRPTPTCSRSCDVLRGGRREGTFDAGIETRAAADPREPEVRVPRRARPGERRRRRRLPHQRPRAGVAAVVLPVEQHSRRRAARRSRARASCSDPAVLEQQVRRMLADPRVDGARRPISPASGCSCATSKTSCRTPTSSRISTTTCARRSRARPSCSSRASCARTAASLDLLTADYTFVNERLARHYGIPDIYGSQFRRVAGRPTRRAGGCSGKGSILAVTSHADAHVAGAARQVGAREHPRHAAAAAAAERAAARRNAETAQKPRTMREQMEEHRAQPGLRELPQGDGSDRLRAGELRRRRRVARRATPARRSTRRASWPTARKVDGVVALRKALVEPPGGVRRHADREAADLRARPRPRLPRHAGGARDRARRRRASDYRFSSIVLGIVNSTPFQMRVKAGIRSQCRPSGLL